MPFYRVHSGGGGRGGRGVPVRRRTFHSAGTPGGSTHAQDDSDMGSVQNAAAGELLKIIC